MDLMELNGILCVLQVTQEPFVHLALLELINTDTLTGFALHVTTNQQMLIILRKPNLMQIAPMLVIKDLIP